MGEIGLEVAQLIYARWTGLEWTRIIWGIFSWPFGIEFFVLDGRENGIYVFMENGGD